MVCKIIWIWLVENTSSCLVVDRQVYGFDPVVSWRVHFDELDPGAVLVFGLSETGRAFVNGECFLIGDQNLRFMYFQFLENRLRVMWGAHALGVEVPCPGTDFFATSHLICIIIGREDVAIFADSILLLRVYHCGTAMYQDCILMRYAVCLHQDFTTIPREVSANVRIVSAGFSL